MSGRGWPFGLAPLDRKAVGVTVTVANVAVALGRDEPDAGSPEFAQWSMWIADAVMLVEAKRLQVNPDKTLDALTVDYVVREAVVAQVKKPDDATQVTVSIDDGSTSKSYRSSKGRVTILDEWWALLGLVDNRAAFSVDMVPRVVAHSLFCPASSGAVVCVCGAV